MEGEGMYRSSKGDVYFGALVNNMFHGHGVMQVWWLNEPCCVSLS